MRASLILILLASVLAYPSSAQVVTPNGRACATVPRTTPLKDVEDIGGRHITAQGTLRILIVFASFSDDETPNPFWPPHQPPALMDQFIDPDTVTNSAGSFNLTNYFRQMSLNQFHLIGDALWVESRHSQQEYSNGSFGRANTSMLTEQVDSLVDFSRYDSWTNVTDYLNENVPDSLVDMIVMVWRTNIFPYVGEASLGRKPTLLLDGKRIGMGYPEDLANPVGSGVTCEFLYGDTPGKVMRTMAHEIGHWLLGGAHPYNGGTFGGKHSYWGILCDGNRISSCMNAYERETLGWVTLPIVQPDVVYALPDFVHSGQALKFHPVNGDPLEFFYFENHQRQSVFDDVSLNLNDRGLWVLHQDGPYQELDNLRIEPSDGRWTWMDEGIRGSCFEQPLPLFQKGEPGVENGFSHRDMIPTQASEVNWLSMIKDQFKQIHCGLFFGGEAFHGAFDVATATVFSRYSNPSSNTWDNHVSGLTLEITAGPGGEVLVHSFADSLAPSPARRYLGLVRRSENAQEDSISLAWGPQWADGQPLEPNIELSELERMGGLGASWTQVYQGPLTQWSDKEVRNDTTGTIPISYRVRTRDNKGRYSDWSEPCVVMASAVPTGVTQRSGGPSLPREMMLRTNFPNPFNASTTIEFSIAYKTEVTIEVYDLLGHRIARLVDRTLDPGVYRARWMALDYGSGTYFCKMNAGGSIVIRKLSLLK